MQGKQQANKAHFDVGKEVRDTIERLGARCPRTCQRLKRAYSNCAERKRNALHKGRNFRLLRESRTEAARTAASRPGATGA